MPDFDVDAALARHKEREATKLGKRRQFMSECRCPDDGVELVLGPDEIAVGDSRPDIVTASCPQCGFWMRVFERDNHRPWMKRAWDVLFERTD